MTAHRRLLDSDADYRAKRAALENATIARKGARLAARADTTHIPVVVHVVYRTLTENISAEQVAGQIDVLNQDFNGRNRDIATVPPVWIDAVGDGRTAFALADLDPAGVGTSGIVRTSTSVDAFGDDDGVKFASRGGSNAWPSDRYLNIWVCHLGDLLGYAQFPGGPAESDGVVIDFRAFGVTGTAEPPFDLGRTATHEVGHWLNLFHIWGDDGTGCGGTDEVDDTPNQAGPNTGAPVFPRVTCDNGPNGDMFVNFMDYVDDRSMVMFTAGQVERMHSALDTARPAFVVGGPPHPQPLAQWVHNDLVLTAAAPEAAGDPVVVVSPEGRVRVFYRGTDRRIHELRQRND